MTVRVTSSPGLAKVVVVLSDAMLIVRAGAVRSSVTWLLSVVAVAVVPILSERSIASIAIAITPSVSPDAIALTALQEVPDPLTVAVCPPIKTEGVVIVSLDVKVTVTLSPAVARLV